MNVECAEWPLNAHCSPDLKPRLIFPAPPQLAPNPACAQMTHFSSAFLHLQKHQATLPCSCPQHPSMTVPGSALCSGPPGPSSWLLSRSPVFSLPVLPSLSRAAGRIFGSSDHVQPSSNVFHLLSLRPAPSPPTPPPGLLAHSSAGPSPPLPGCGLPPSPPRHPPAFTWATED